MRSLLMFQQKKERKNLFRLKYEKIRGRIQKREIWKMRLNKNVQNIDSYQKNLITFWVKLNCLKKYF